MGAPIFLGLLELLRILATLGSFAALLLAAAVLFAVPWLVRRGRPRIGGAALAALVVSAVLLAALGFLWLNHDGVFGPDSSLLTLRPNIGPLYALAATPDGEWVFVGGGIGSVALCQVDRRATCYRESDEGFSNFEAVALSPDGRLAAAVTNLCQLKVWRRAGRSLALLHAGPLDGSSCAALHLSSQDSESLYGGWLTATGDDERDPKYIDALHRLDARSGEVVARFGEPVPVRDHRTRGATTADLPVHVGRLTGIDDGPSGGTLVTSSWDGTVKIWRTDASRPLRSFGPGDRWLNDVAVGRSRIVAAGGDGRLWSWDLAGNESDCRLEPHRPGPLPFLRGIVAVDYAPATGLAVSAAFDRRVVVSDLSACAVVDSLRGHRREVTAVAFVRQATRVLSASLDGTVRLWSVAPAAGRSEVDAAR